MKSGLDAKPLFLQVDMLSQQLVPNDCQKGPLQEYSCVFEEIYALMCAAYERVAQ